MWHSPLNGIGRRMVPFAIYSLPDSRVKCLSPLVGVPVIAHQQRLTFSCSSPFRCSHLTLSSSLFLIHSPYIVSLQYPLLCSICTRSLFILFFSRRDKSAAASAQLVPSAIIHLERARRKGETTGADYVKLGHVQGIGKDRCDHMPGAFTWHLLQPQISKYIRTPPNAVPIKSMILFL
jgi:hypothetical protein